MFTKPLPERLDMGRVGGLGGTKQNADPRDLPRQLRPGGKWRKKDADSENDERDPAHGHLGWGRLPGSLAERHDAHQHSAARGMGTRAASRGSPDRPSRASGLGIE